jgi:hypothetical protein
MRTQQTIPISQATALIAAFFAGANLHQRQVLSFSHGVLGAMYSERAGLAHFGRAMARVRGASAKHAIKQLDRLLSNDKIPDDEVFRRLLGFALSNRSACVVALDWTEYAAEGHHRIALSLVTRHGRATPLIWRIVRAEDLKDHRNDHEDELLRRFKRLMPATLSEVILLADRGFGDIKLYDMLRNELGFHYVIRFKDCIHVEAEGQTRTGAEWVPRNGKARLLRGARVTGEKYEVGAVVAVKRKGMKDNWLLATSLPWGGDRVVQLYGRRFTIEENFRDEKDDRFGYGSLEVPIDSPQRRTRFLQIIAISTILLTLFGAAGERLGLDALLRANTVKRRTHSLFRQGREYIRGCIGSVAEIAERLCAEVRRGLSGHLQLVEMYGDI